MSATDLPVFVAASNHGHYKRRLPAEARWLDAFPVKVPPGTTELGEDAFRDCKGLAQITLPAGLTHIGWGGFKNCCGRASIPGLHPPGRDRPSLLG